jgi:hypothetical protein
MAGVLLINEKIMGDAEFFPFVFFDKRPLERHDALHRLRFDESLRNHLEHGQYYKKTKHYALLQILDWQKLNQSVKDWNQCVKYVAQAIHLNRHFRFDKAQNGSGWPGQNVLPVFFRLTPNR